MLLRETIRQGVLIAARDELGVSTRDPVLWEFIGSKPLVPMFRFTVLCPITSRAQVSISLRRQDGAKQKELWSSQFQISSENELSPLVEKVEALSRKEFRDALKKGGLSGKPHQIVENAPVPKDIESLLGQWNFIAEFAAVRRLHAEIRRAGESPQLLAALARGYANLGTLTEAFWSPAHKGFKARALLYAERLVARTKQSPWSLWNRAYVRALVGMHRDAIKDLQAADKAAAADKQHAPTAPNWIPIIKAFVWFDEPRLKSAADKKGPQQALARYLQMLSIEFPGYHNQVIRATARMLEVRPDCFRAMDMVASIRALGVGSAGVSQSTQRLASRLYVLLPVVPNLPKTVTKLIEAGRQVDSTEQDSELVLRVKLMKALRGGGWTGTDRDEPSLATLAELIQEVTFLQSIQALNLQRYIFASDSRNMMESLEPLNAGHPFAAYLKKFSMNTKDRLNVARQLLKTIPRPYLEGTENRAIAEVHARNFRSAYVLRDLATAHSDRLFRDDLRDYYHYAWDNSTAALRVARDLPKISPRAPQAVAIQLEADWSRAALHALWWEKKYSDNVQIQRVLGNQYLRIGLNQKAIQCYKRVLNIEPSYAAYVRLAAVYKRQSKIDLWRQTMEATLSLPAQGLEHAQTRDLIAKDYMSRKQWKKALPYADAAAQSYAGWALRTARDCHAALKDWKAANTYASAEAHRYPSTAFEWFLWCHRTGHGDVAAAQELSRKYFESLGTSATPAALQHIGTYYLLTDEPAKAFEVFKTIDTKSRDPYFSMFAAILADEIHKTKDRDRLLKKFLRKGAPHGKAVVGIAKLIQQDIARGGHGNLDLQTVDKLIQSCRPGQPTLFDYFVGRYLLNHGKKKEAAKYLKRAAESPWVSVDTVPAAAQLARKLGISLGERRQREIVK